MQHSTTTQKGQRSNAKQLTTENGTCGNSTKAATAKMARQN
jgi:hypothetical protein